MITAVHSMARRLAIMLSVTSTRLGERTRNDVDTLKAKTEKGVVTKSPSSKFAFLRLSRIWLFHVFVLQRTAKKCTKIYNARAQPLFNSLNLLFGDVLVAVVVVVCLRSLKRVVLLPKGSITQYRQESITGLRKIITSK